MTVRIEVTPELLGRGLEGLEALRERITQNLREELLITPRVEFVEPGTIPSSEGKAVRVEDKRPEE